MGKYEKFSAYTVTAISTSGIQEVQDQREKKISIQTRKKKEMEKAWSTNIKTAICRIQDNPTAKIYELGLLGNRLSYKSICCILYVRHK